MTADASPRPGPFVVVRASFTMTAKEMEMPTAKPVPGKMLLSPADHTLILKSQSGLIKLVPGIIHTWQGPEYGYVTQMTRHFSVAPESPICESGY